MRAHRKRHGFSQEELADICELHRTYIGSVEREERNVTLSTLEVLAKALGVSVPSLLTPGAKHVGKDSSSAMFGAAYQRHNSVHQRF